MNVVPVAKDSQNQQKKRDHQQTCGFGGVDRVALVLMGVLVLGVLFAHANIVALSQTKFQNCSAAVPAAVRRASSPAAPRARRPRKMSHPCAAIIPRLPR